MNIVQPRIPLNSVVFDHRGLWEPFNNVLVARLMLDPRSFQMELDLMRMYGLEYMFHYYVCVALNFASPLQHDDLTTAMMTLESLEQLFKDHEWEALAKLDTKFVLAKCYLWHGFSGSALIHLMELKRARYQHAEFDQLLQMAYQDASQAA